MSLPEDFIKNVEEITNIIQQNGPGFLEQLKPAYANNPSFSFIFPESPYYSYFRERLDAKLRHTQYGGQQSSPQNNPHQQYSEKGNQGGRSRWGAPLYTGPSDPSSFNTHQYNQPNIQNQQYGNYNMMQKSGPIYSNQPNMGNQNQFNQQYMNYEGTNQGQFYQNQQNFPNYSMGNAQPPLYSMNQNMQYGNNQNMSGLPSYMISPKSQEKSPHSSGSREMELESHHREKTPKKYQTPEDVPVGIMADMLKQQAKKYKDKNMTLRPYTPLDPEATPQVLPSVNKVSDSLRTKINLFYKFLADEREIDSLSKRKKSSSDIDLEAYKQKGHLDKKSREALDKKFPSAPGIPDYQELLTSEMGVRADGRSITSVPGGGEERRGLGGGREDIYSQFRKQRSHTYHVTAEERSVNRDVPDLCYICRLPGHLARDCKFGLT